MARAVPPVAIALLASVLLGAGAQARADLVDVARSIHNQGCGAHAGARTPLRARSELVAAAQQWARGMALRSAIIRSGYRELKSSAIHISGTDRAATDALRSRFCVPLTDHALADIGAVRHGNEIWIILAAPLVTPQMSDAPAIAEHLLGLINQARSRARRCGGIAFAAAPPLRSQPQLDRVALSHAQDMAQQNYFAHEDRTGRSPADRVRQTGYRDQLVGENIALGAMNADEAVQGWLASPGHCENLMNPRFSEMGVGFAVSGGAEPRVYWVQDLATPR